VDSDALEQQVPPEARYANSFNIGHNAYEFVFEFGQLYETEDMPRIHTRIVTSPAYAREFLNILQQALAEHEGSMITEAGPKEGQN
jgi:hypothetical protein